MTIQEAIKSGKRFRISRWVKDFYVGPVDNLDNENHEFTVEQVLADDWEVEEEIFTLTRMQLASLLVRYMESSDPIDDLIDGLKK